MKNHQNKKVSLLMLIIIGLLSCNQSIPENKETMKLSEYKLAMIQMKVEGGKLENNLERAVNRIAEAAKNEAKIALLPETMDLGWTHPSAKELAGEIPGGKACNILSKAAKDHSIFLCAGLTERDGDNIYNSAVIINPEGKIILKHRKLNELDIGHHLYDQGDRLNVVHTELGTLGLFICADARSDDFTLAKSLGYMGADIILSPSAWAVPPHHDNLKDPYGSTWTQAYIPMTKKFKMWIVSVSNVGIVEAGAWKGWNCIGCSMAVNPDGEEFIKGPYGKEADSIMFIDIKLRDRPARGTGWTEYWTSEEKRIENN